MQFIFFFSCFARLERRETIKKQSEWTKKMRARGKNERRTSSVLTQCARPVFECSTLSNRTESIHLHPSENVVYFSHVLFHERAREFSALGLESVYVCDLVNECERVNARARAYIQWKRQNNSTYRVTTRTHTLEKIDTKTCLCSFDVGYWHCLHGTETISAIRNSKTKVAKEKRRKEATTVTRNRKTFERRKRKENQPKIHKKRKEKIFLAAEIENERSGTISVHRQRSHSRRKRQNKIEKKKKKKNKHTNFDQTRWIFLFFSCFASVAVNVFICACFFWSIFCFASSCHSRFSSFASFAISFRVFFAFFFFLILFSCSFCCRVFTQFDFLFRLTLKRSSSECVCLAFRCDEENKTTISRLHVSHQSSLFASFLFLVDWREKKTRWSFVDQSKIKCDCTSLDVELKVNILILDVFCVFFVFRWNAIEIFHRIEYKKATWNENDRFETQTEIRHWKWTSIIEMRARINWLAFFLYTHTHTFSRRLSSTHSVSFAQFENTI